MAILEKLKYMAGFPARVIRKYKKRNEYIDYVCEASGWTRKETIAAMKKANKEGISYRYYAKKRLWSRTEAQMQQVQKNAAANQERKQAEAEHAVEEVMKATGWSRLAAEEKVKEARQSCGSSYKDYYRFRLYEKTPEEQKEFFTLGVFETLSFKYNPDPAAIRTLLQKGRFAKKFSKQFNRVWFINRDITFEEFSTLVQDLDQLICKPLSSTQGKGIIRIRFSEYENLHAVYDELMGMKKMICEECIVQHPAIAAFNDSSVNTVRVLTIVDGTGENRKCHHVYAGFRMGRGELVDNFHAGGIIASVDPKTGITIMDAIDLDGNHYQTHPVSGLEILGFQLPNWDKVLEVTEKAALKLAVRIDEEGKATGASMVGWDVAITPDGACLVEGNSEPSHSIIQLPFVESGKGMRYLVEEFLD